MGLISTLAWRIAPVATARLVRRMQRQHFAPPPRDGRIRLNLSTGDTLPGFVGVGGDLRRLGYPSDHANEILSVHGIQTVPVGDVPELLAEWRRVLKPGGTLTLECPNLLYAARQIVQAEQPPFDIGREETITALLYGTAAAVNRWGWTPRTLAAALTRAGFTAVREEPPVFKTRAPCNLRIVATKLATPSRMQEA